MFKPIGLLNITIAREYGEQPLPERREAHKKIIIKYSVHCSLQFDGKAPPRYRAMILPYLSLLAVSPLSIWIKFFSP